jgi:hypothetical protein
MTTYSERQALAEQSANEVLRIRQCFRSAGMQVRDYVVRSSARHSASFAHVG